MAVKPSNGVDYPNKRQRLETATIPTKFVNASQIRSALRVENSDGLTEALTSLRNQLTLKAHEAPVSPQDDRLALVKQWVENSPGAQDLFGLWDHMNSRQSSVISLVIANLSSVLTLLSSHYTDHALGHPIMKALLNPSRLRQLNSYIGGSHNELIIVTLKLFNVMSNFAGGRDRKSVLEGFGWEIKSLPKLLNMRRKTHGVQDRTDPLLRPDIRTLYILLLLLFVDADCPAQIKSLFLEQHRDAFLAIFKGLYLDHYSLARKVLEVCWAGIWSDSKIKRTLKVGLFNETTIGHLIKLYDRSQSDDDDEDHIPANLVHHFLLAICTRPGIGICFKDRGWYPRESDPDDITPKEDEDTKRKSGKIYNKILANILRTLKINEDSRQQELAIKILSACSELIAGYWSAAALTLEPRLSSKWITNVSFFGTIIALPIPSGSFYLPNTQLYQPTPPSLSTVIENILPSVNTKNNFSKGLQSPSGLVQHCSALALCKCLIKFRAVLEHFRAIATALEEDTEVGQWSKRCQEIEREVRRRVPEFQVIVAFSQQKQPTSGAHVNQTKMALLAESAQRLLWLYKLCLPSIVAEARFDVGKLLQAFSTEAQSSVEDGPDVSPDARLYRVHQLHVLRLLKDSDQFIWTGKIASLPRTPFHILMAALTSAAIPAIRTALTSVLRHILSQSILFQEDRHEPDLWLKALPRNRPDQDMLLQDETDGVISFLDDCVQRCVKTPYRYVEALRSLAQTSNTNFDVLSRLDMYPSPLLMTVLEQVDAKMTNKSLASSQILGITSFIRKLVFYLASKTSDLHILRAYADKLDNALAKEGLPKDSGRFSVAIRREIDILHASLSFRVFDVPNTVRIQEAQDYLAKNEQMPIPDTKQLRTAAALQLVDWMCTLNHALETTELKRLTTMVASLDPSLLPAVVESLIPSQANLWSAMDLLSTFSEYRPYLKFEWLYLHTSSQEIVDESCRVVLADTVFTQSPSLTELVRVVYLVMHALSASRQQDSVMTGHISLFARILRSSNTVLSSADFGSLKEVVFLQPGVLKDIMMSPSSSEVLQAIGLLLKGSVDPISGSDRRVVSDISNHWFIVLKTGLVNHAQASISAACAWIKYLEPSQLFDLLDFLHEDGRSMPSISVLEPINVVLQAMSSMASSEWQAEATLVQRLPQLLSIRAILPDSSLLEDVIAIAVEASLPMGLDGCPPSSSTSDALDMVTVIRRSKVRWSQRAQSMKIDMDIRQFLMQDVFSDSTVKIVSGLLYRRPSFRETFLQWMTSEDCLRQDIRHLLPIVHAFLDSSLSGASGPTLNRDIWTPLLSSIIHAITDQDGSSDLRLRAQRCLFEIFLASRSEPSELLVSLAAELKALSTSTVSVEMFSTGVWLASHFGPKAKSTVSVLVDRGMQWSINSLAEDHEDDDSKRVICELTTLVKTSGVSKPHLVETLMSVVIQNHLSSVTAVNLAIACLSSCQLKPVVVNKHLQSIIQHPYFFKICIGSSPEAFKAREALVELLYYLFNLHPANTCQITHIEPLIKIYKGTLSTSDLRIFSIFQLFESQRKLSVTPLLSRWSSTANMSSQSALEALQSLDPIVVLRTCLNFPRWRRLEDQTSVKVDEQDSVLYDPIFLMLLFSQMLAEQPPSSAFAWIEMFRTNVVSLFIRALSAKDGQMRELALCQIIALWRHMETADLQEKPHVQYTLNLLKDLLPTPTPSSSEPSISDYPRQLPTYTTLLLMHALRGIFHPSNFIYPLTARFLLQRPSLDTTDVPMLYGMLYSSSDENWKKERTWIIRFLADGMIGSEDWKVLKRRHTWDLLTSLFQSTDGDAALRLSILEVLANLTCNAQATTSLLLKSALLPWIEMQLFNSTLTPSSSVNAEGVEWIKILENILVIVDAPKIEASTNGEWRAVICRCLTYLLDEERCMSTAENFPYAVPVILRLASLAGPKLADFSPLLDRAAICLEKLESDIQLPSSLSSYSIQIGGDDFRSTILPSPPHRSFTLHQRKFTNCASNDSLLLWGTLLEMLWRSSMSLEKKCPAWDALTPRLLVWRSIIGVPSNVSISVAEWARKEVVANMQDGVV